MTAAAGVVTRALSTVEYLRVTIGAGTDDGRTWLPSSALVTDPELLRDVVRPTAAERGTDRDDVALSLFVQGYAFRVASIAIIAWFLDGVVLDVDPRGMSIALGRGRPNAVRLDEARLVAGDVDPEGVLTTLHEVIVDGHLAPLVANARAAIRAGEPLLWSNVGAAFASSFGALMAPLPDRRLEVRERFEAFLAAARPELRTSGRIAHVGSLWAWERAACCLWYLTESGFKCEDCSLWRRAELDERYERMITGGTP